MKSAQIRNFSGPYFPASKTPNTGTFLAVMNTRKQGNEQKIFKFEPVLEWDKVFKSGPIKSLGDKSLQIFKDILLSILPCLLLNTSSHLSFLFSLFFMASSLAAVCIYIYIYIYIDSPQLTIQQQPV